jgi:hypothetical protein
MTEEACKALDRLREGNPIECSADAYHWEIRDALISRLIALTATTLSECESRSQR